MSQQIVKWKELTCINQVGKEVDLDLARIVDIRVRGRLLSEILHMPKKKPISLNSSLLMLLEKQREAFKAGQFGDNPGEYGWYDLNFTNWISSLGFHIELTGDEFKSHLTSEKSA